MTTSSSPLDTEQARRPRAARATTPLSREQRTAWHGLFRVSQQILRRLDAELVQRFDLAVSGAELLFLLRQSQAPVRVTDLSEKVLISQSSVSRTVDRMVQRGLVQRSASSTDGRATYVSITPDGASLVDLMRVTEESIVREMLIDHLDNAHVEALVDVWQAIGWVSLDPHVPVRPTEGS